jgi:hypothetical protein
LVAFKIAEMQFILGGAEEFLYFLELLLFELHALLLLLNKELILPFEVFIELGNLR